MISIIILYSIIVTCIYNFLFGKLGNPLVNHLYLSESGLKRLEQLECIARVQKLASKQPQLDVESYGYAHELCNRMTQKLNSYEYQMADYNQVIFDIQIEKFPLTVYWCRSI